MTFESILNEHRKGWDVIENEQKLFSLDFVNYEVPFFEFKVIGAQCQEEKVGEILRSNGRDPQKNLKYKNRVLDVVVDDESFAGGYDGLLVRFRDCRLYQNLKWWQKILNS
jgi:hypothetical protein